MLNKGLGAVISPHDPRDFTLARVGKPVLMAFPDEFRLPTPPNAPYDQDVTSMCVAFSLAIIKSIQEYKERGAWNDYSPAYIYARREPEDWQGEGMRPREACACLLKRGVPALKEFSAIGTYQKLVEELKQRAEELDYRATPQKIKSYVSVYTVEEIKTALMTIGPVLQSTPVYSSFVQGGHLPLPDKSREEFYGNHATVIIGWTRDNRWLCINSWGKNWGPLNGFFTIPFDYPVNERWSITDMEPVEPTIRLRVGSNEYYVGSKVKTMDAAPMITNDRTFIPVRFIAEELGCTVDWNEEKQEVIITRPIR